MEGLPLSSDAGMWDPTSSTPHSSYPSSCLSFPTGAPQPGRVCSMCPYGVCSHPSPSVRDPPVLPAASQPYNKEPISPCWNRGG